MDARDLMLETQSNSAIFDSVCKCASVLPKYDKIYCSISGGKDSDIMLDLVYKLDERGIVRYVWFDTGMEYAATKAHLIDLEKKYGIQIERIRPRKPIPLSVHEYGQPFLSKFVSSMIGRLQKHGFTWEDEPYETLIQRYSNCKAALDWWCNNQNMPGFSTSMFNINYHKYLKDFMIENPPWFKINSKCCDYAKKAVAHDFERRNSIQLSITGIRKCEKGIRSAVYSNCYSVRDNNVDQYRPLFWYSNTDEEEYDEIFGICHSDCYELWGMSRTGCVGCPFNRQIAEELNLIRQYEPKMYSAVQSLFHDSYEYTQMYRKYVKEKKAREKK